MIAEEREKAEGLEQCRSKVLSKVRSYLRTNFPGEDAKVNPDAVKALLLQVAVDWCVNRGVKIGMDELKSIVEEGYEEHCHDWQGKESGSDVRGRPLGDGGRGFLTSYCT